jgi:hypothetical protein
MKYKHKPTEIEAEQWNPKKDSEEEEGKEGKGKDKDKEGKPDPAKEAKERILKVVQHSVDGDYVAVNGHPVYIKPGDYITSDGRVIKAGEFERDYEPAGESKEKK